MNRPIIDYYDYNKPIMTMLSHRNRQVAPDDYCLIKSMMMILFAIVHHRFRGCVT